MATIVCILGGSIGSEFLQFAVTQGKRNFDPWDMVVNLSGSTLGMTLFYISELYI